MFFLWLAYSTYPSSSWSSWGKNKTVFLARLGYQPINIASTLLACSWMKLFNPTLAAQSNEHNWGHTACLSIKLMFPWLVVLNEEGCYPRSVWQHPISYGIWGINYLYDQRPKHLSVITLPLIFCHFWLIFNVILGKRRLRIYLLTDYLWTFPTSLWLDLFI